MSQKSQTGQLGRNYTKSIMDKKGLSLDTSNLVKPPNGRTVAVGCDQSEQASLASKGRFEVLFISEDELIHAAQRNDLEAFNQLVLAHQDRIYNQAYYLLGDPMAAEDATQEAFISAYRGLSTFRGGSFRAWLSRIVTNKCLDELRRHKSQQVIPFDVYNRYGEEIESPYWSIDPTETPEESLIRGEFSDFLIECLDRLNPKQRTILVLVDVLGMSYNEAAGSTGWPLGTVKSRLARARMRMQFLVQENRSSEMQAKKEDKSDAYIPH